MEQRLEAIIDREIAEGGADAFGRRLFEPMASIPVTEWKHAPERLAKHVARRRDRVVRSRGGTPLLMLIQRAHRSVRNGPLLALRHPEHHGRATLHAWKHVLDVSRTRGEARANAILDAIAVIWEGVYQPYLQCIWKLAEVAAGRAPPSPPSQGPLVAALERMLTPSSASLLEPRAVRIRNAVAHRHFEYLPKQRAVMLSNKDGWTETFPVHDLEGMMHEMLVISTGTFDEAMNAFTEDAFMRPLLPLLPAFARAVVADDRAEVERIGLLVNDEAAGIWRDVAILFGRAPASTS